MKEKVLTDKSMQSGETGELVQRFRGVSNALRSEVGRIVVGQDHVVEHLLITLLVGGHCLVTGMPGTAKTLLVRTLADALGLNFNRIQFTPDLMPTDITGTDIIEQDDSGARNWRFVPGPIFTNVLLAVLRNGSGFSAHYRETILCTGNPKSTGIGRYLSVAGSSARSILIQYYVGLSAA